MANRIKGITIEIDGNTTKLSDSLKSVDKSLKTTQTNLKDVNKLLKMDPSNVELLTQKHDLLGQAVKDTKKRQEELKKALEQARNAGDTTKNREQQDALQRELEETTQSLKSLLLRQQIDIIGVFHLVEDADDFLRRKGHTQSDGRTSPSLRHRIQHDEIGMFG